jgi:hypothetical protein
MTATKKSEKIQRQKENENGKGNVFLQVNKKVIWQFNKKIFGVFITQTPHLKDKKIITDATKSSPEEDSVMPDCICFMTPQTTRLFCSGVMQNTHTMIWIH